MNGTEYFIDSWLSPCSLCSHRTANSTPKNGYAIFRLCPPTTQIQADNYKRNNEVRKCDIINSQKSYFSTKQQNSGHLTEYKF